MRRRRGRTRRGPGARVRVCGGACREPVPWGTEVLGARLAGRTSVLQWNTALAVTRPSWVGVSHFQNATSSGMANALTFCLVSKLNTCRGGGQGTATRSSVRVARTACRVAGRRTCSWSTWVPGCATFRAMTREPGLISALSAVMGRRTGAPPPGVVVSTITTLFWPPGWVAVSRTHTHLSLSMDTVVKLMLEAATPSAGSWASWRWQASRQWHALRSRRGKKRDAR